jgi:hypothetical protein
MRSFGFLIVMILAFAAQADNAPLQLIGRIPLPDGRGRIDHLALDPGRHRLFVAELGNNTVAVVDLQAGKMTGRITGLVEPQGVVFAPEFDRLFVSSGGTGSVTVFDGGALAQVRTVDLGSDADNARYDPAARQVYVGFGDGALGAIAAADAKHLGDIALTGHPESFQLATGGPRIFVNVPAAGQIAVVDRVRRSTLATWRVTGARANFPMALDERDHRLVVATWQPPTLIVFDTESGEDLGRTGICADADDIFYDAPRRQLYVSCGEGFLDVLALRDAAMERIARIATAAGARTSLFVPELDRFYVAVPHRGTQQAEILVYRPS